MKKIIPCVLVYGHEDKMARKQVINGIIFSSLFVLLVTILTITCILVFGTQRFASDSSMALTRLKSTPDSKIEFHEFTDIKLTVRKRKVHGGNEDQECHFSDEILSMATGVDITKLDLLPLSLVGIEGNPGVKSQLIKLTCIKNLTKLDSNGNLISKFPDQFVPNSYETISAVGFSSTTNDHMEKQTMDSKLSIAGTVGVSLYKFGMFSASASYVRKRKSMIARSSYFAEMNAYSLVRKAEFRSPNSISIPLEANEDFQYFVLNTLAPTFDQDPDSYFELLRKYGTHYFASARFGGYLKVNTEVTKKLQEKMSEDRIQATLSASYKMFLQGSINADAFASSTAQEFNGLTMSSTFIHGGDASLAYAGKLEKWLQSIPHSPRLIGGSLQPISKLIGDKSKAEALDKAIQIHLGKAYIGDLRACLHICLTNNVGDSYFQKQILESMKELSNQTVTDERQLKYLGQQVSQSIHEVSTGNVSLTILQAERTSPMDSTPSCSHVEFTIFSGNNKDEHGVFKEFKQIKSFRTTLIQSFEPKWIENFTFVSHQQDFIQLCFGTKTCELSAVTTEELECAQRIQILSPENRENGIENLIRFTSVNLIFKLSWELVFDSMENSEISPI